MKNKANLIIEVNVTCPYSDNHVDLFEIDDGRLNDFLEICCPPPELPVECLA